MVAFRKAPRGKLEAFWRFLKMRYSSADTYEYESPPKWSNGRRRGRSPLGLSRYVNFIKWEEAFGFREDGCLLIIFASVLCPITFTRHTGNSSFSNYTWRLKKGYFSARVVVAVVNIKARFSLWSFWSGKEKKVDSNLVSAEVWLFFNERVTVYRVQ